MVSDLRFLHFENRHVVGWQLKFEYFLVESYFYEMLLCTLNFCGHKLHQITWLYLLSWKHFSFQFEYCFFSGWCRKRLRELQTGRLRYFARTRRYFQFYVSSVYFGHKAKDDLPFLRFSRQTNTAEKQGQIWNGFSRREWYFFNSLLYYQSQSTKPHS